MTEFDEAFAEATAAPFDADRLIRGDCREVLKTFPTGSFDAVICDPPYPGIKRPYGYWTELEWFDLMNPLVTECRRVLKPSGSAVFILQPNSETVGRMRPWLWEFMAKWTREWGMVQDLWWWNFAQMPGGGEGNRRDLLRPSIKPCVWLGNHDCYRNRSDVMIDAAESTKKLTEAEGRYGRSAGCHGINRAKIYADVQLSGEATPFNVLPFSNGAAGSAGAISGHSAGTPLALVRWLVRYICPPRGRVLDPFIGSGTTILAAREEGRSCVGIERGEAESVMCSKRTGLTIEPQNSEPEPI